MNPWLVSGVTGAAPMWNKITRFVLKDQPDEWPVKPDNIEGRQVCNLITKPKDGQSEEEKKANCQERYEYFIKGTREQNLIERKEISIDPTTGRPPEEGKTDGLITQEHTLASDPFVKDYCLDCNHDGEKATIVNIEIFNKKKAAEKNSKPSPPNT